MKIPPLNKWYRHQVSRGLYKTSYYLPYESPAHLDALKAYWENRCPDLIQVREHAWGGCVHHTDVPALDKHLYFKLFSIRNLRYIHKPIRARATVRTEIKLSQLDFKTAPLIGLIEKSILGVVLDSAVVAEEIPNSFIAARWLVPSVEPILTPDSARVIFLTTLGRGVGEWHNAGLFHGDMHMGNIMSVRSGEEDFTLYWLDNEEGKLYTNLPLRKRLHDLDHMARFMRMIPKHEHQIFWDSYTKTCNIHGAEKTAIAEKLIRRINRYWRRKNIDYSVD